MSWGDTPNSNKFKQSYIQGFLDISSGNLIVQKASKIQVKSNTGDNTALQIGSTGFDIFAGQSSTSMSYNTFAGLSTIGASYENTVSDISNRLQFIGATTIGGNKTLIGVSGGSNLEVYGTLSTKSFNGSLGHLFIHGDASFNNNVYVTKDLSVSQSLFVTNRSLFNGDVSMNQNLSLTSATQNRSISINKGISSEFALDVSGATLFRSKVSTVADVSINGKLSISDDVSLNKNVTVAGTARFGAPPASTAGYEFDINGQVRIYEATGSNVTSNTSVGTLTLEHGNANGTSSIMFTSPSTTNGNGDYAYIKYQDGSGATTNTGLLTIGIENDPTATATADKISLYAAGGSGYVGVNTLTPAFNLDVSGTTNISSTLTVNRIDASNALSQMNIATTVTDGVVRLGTGITSNGTLQIGTHSGLTYLSGGSLRLKDQGNGTFWVGRIPGDNVAIDSIQIALASGVQTNGSVKIMDGSGSTGTITIGRDGAIKIINSTVNNRFTVDISGAIKFVNNTLNNKKLILFESGGAEDQLTATSFYGFGVNEAVLRYQTSGNTDKHKFYSGTSNGLVEAGNLKLLDTTASTNSTSGALIVSGGVGIAQNLIVAKDVSLNQNVAVTGAMNVSGKVTAGNTISLPNNLNNKKLVLYDNSAGENPLTATDFLGFGINDTMIRYQTSKTTEKHKFYSGTSNGLVEAGNLKLLDTTASTNSTSGALIVSGGVGIAQNLIVAKDVSLNQNLAVTGTARFGAPPASAAGYEFDINGQMRIYEATGSNITGNTSVATLTLEHGNDVGTSSIMFKSPATAANGDYAYIKYQDLLAGGSSIGLLTVGIENDPMGSTLDRISLYATGGKGYIGVNTLTPQQSLDVSGQMRIFEGTGTAASDTSGTLILEHANAGGTSSLVFKGANSVTKDYAYVQYQDNNTVIEPTYKWDLSTNVPTTWSNAATFASSGTATTNLTVAPSDSSLNWFLTPGTKPSGFNPTYCVSFNQTNVTDIGDTRINYLQGDVIYSSTFSLSLWFYPTFVSVAGRYITIASLSQFGIGGYSAEIAIDGNNQNLALLANNNSTAIMQTANSIVTINTWYHLVFTYNSITRESKLYLNNSLRASTTSTAINPYSMILIGMRYGQNTGSVSKGFRGGLCFVNLLNVELNSSEVSQLYTNADYRIKSTDHGLMTIGIENETGYVNNDRIALWPGAGQGLVGINTQNPQATLDISGNANVSNILNVSNTLTVNNIEPRVLNGQMNIATTQTGVLNIGTGVRSSGVNGAVNINTNGGSSAATNIGGGTISIQGSGNLTFNTSFSTGPINIVTGNRTAGGSFSIGTGTTTNSPTDAFTGSRTTSTLSLGSGDTSGSTTNVFSGAYTASTTHAFSGTMNNTTTNFLSGNAINSVINIATGTRDSNSTINIANNNTAETLNIGTGASRTGQINIGTGSTTSKAVSIGGGANGSTTTITGWNLNLVGGTGIGATINTGLGMTSGSINIGAIDTTATSTAINLGTGSASTGIITIGRREAIKITNSNTATTVDISAAGALTLRGSAITFNGPTAFSNDTSLNQNVKLGSGNRSVAINKDISSQYALDVSGASLFRSKVSTIADVSINGKLSISDDVSLNKNVTVAGTARFGAPPVSTAGYEVDISGQMRIYELTGSNVSSNTSVGTLTLEHGNDQGSSSIMFKSLTTGTNGDYAYIKYQDLSAGAATQGVLTIGIENDPMGATLDRISLYATGGSGYIGVNTLTPTFNLDVSGTTNISNTLTVNKIDASNAASQMDIATTQTSGVLNIGTGNRTGAINIGTGTTGAKTIQIGSDAGGTTELRGQYINLGTSSTSQIQINPTSGGTLNLGTSITGGIVNVGTANITGTLNIGLNAATNGLKVNIATGDPSGGTVNAFSGNATNDSRLNIATGTRNTGIFSLGSGDTTQATTNVFSGAYTNSTTNAFNGAINNTTTNFLSGNATNNAILNIATGTRNSTSTINIATNNDTSQETLNIATGTSRTGPINIGTGTTGVKTIGIGGITTTMNISGSIMNINSTGVLTINNSQAVAANLITGAKTANVNIATGAFTTAGGVLNIMTGANDSSSTLNIANHDTAAGNVKIASGTTSTQTITIGKTEAIKISNLAGATTTTVDISAAGALTLRGGSKIIAVSDVSMNAKLSVQGDTSLNSNVTVRGNISVSNNTIKTIGIGLQQPPASMTANVTDIEGHGTYYAYNSSEPPDAGMFSYNAYNTGLNTPYGYNTVLGVDPSINAWSYGDTISDVVGTAYPGYRFHLDMPYQINLVSFSYTTSRFPVQGSMLGSNDGSNWNNIYSFDLSASYNNRTATAGLIASGFNSFNITTNTAFYSKYALVVKSMCSPRDSSNGTFAARFTMSNLRLVGSNNILSTQGIGTTSIGVSENLTVGGMANVFGNLTVGSTTTNTSMYTNNAAKLLILEPSGSLASATTGSLVLQHSDVSGASSIVFRSTNNSGSDYGYIQYQENVGGTSEKGLLTIGVENDSGSGTSADRISLYAAAGSGFVGVNTKAPTFHLDVSGTANVSNTLTVNKIDVSNVASQMDIATTQTSGTLNIGTDAARTGTIKIGNASNTNTVGNFDISGNSIRLKSGTAVFSSLNTTGDIRFAENMTSGTHQYSHNQSSGALQIASSTRNSGSIEIGNGDNNASHTMYISDGSSNAGALRIATGITSTGTTTIGRGNAIRIVNSNTATTVDISAAGALTLRGSTITFNGSTAFGSDMSLNKNVKLGSGNNSVAINKDISSAFALDVSGDMNVSGKVTTGSTISLPNNSNYKKLVLYDNNASENPSTATNFYGFGISSSAIRYQASTAGDKHKFFSGTNNGVIEAGSLKLLDTTASTNSTSGALIVDGGVGIAQNLIVAKDVSLNQNLAVTGRAIFGAPPASTAGYEFDINGQMRIYEATGSDVTSNTSVATLTLQHGNASGCSSIMFTSPSTTNGNSDYAYIKYQDGSGATTNTGLLTIGIENDPTAAATADKISLYAAGGTGYVGVNTLTPSFNLDVTGTFRVTGATTAAAITATSLSTGTITTSGIANLYATSSTTALNMGTLVPANSTINIGNSTDTVQTTLKLGGNIKLGSGSKYVTVNKDPSLNFFFDVSGDSLFRNNLTINTPTRNNSVAINKDISSQYALDVSGNSLFRGTVNATGTIAVTDGGSINVTGGGSININGTPISTASTGTSLITSGVKIGTDSNYYVSVNKPNFYNDPSLTIYYSFDTSINNGTQVQNLAKPGTYDGLLTANGGSSTGMIDTIKKYGTASLKNSNISNNNGMRIGTNIPVSRTMSFSVWVNYTSAPAAGNKYRILEFTNSISTNQSVESDTIALDISGNGVVYPVLTNGSTTCFTTLSAPIVPYTLTNTGWNHIVWVITPTISYIYVNGAITQVDTITTQVQIVTPRAFVHLAFPYYTPSTQNYEYIGNIDEFRWYTDKVLNQAEIYQLNTNNFYTLDISGGFLANGASVIYEPSGSKVSYNSGTLTLLHGDPSGSSSILFKSVNDPLEYGYIQYEENSAGSTGFHYGLMTIGIENDAGAGAYTTQADRVSLFPSGGRGFVGVNTKTPQQALDVSGQVQAFSFNATSDYRAKDEVVPLNTSFNVDSLNPVTYKFKATGRQDIGFIAHEVQEFYPFLVSGEKDGPHNQSLNYNGFIGILTKEIQDLKKKVSDQEARALVQEARALAQEARIQALEKMVFDK